jgi:alkylation response protein AidB-like acyl-CoA dehydrogenase
MKSENPALDIARSLAALFAARADEADRLGRLPSEDIKDLRGSGYLALNVPCQYGGLDLSLRQCLEAHLELAKGSGSTALVAGMQMQLFGGARDNRPWVEEVYADFCGAAVEGGLFNSVSTEPQMGSPSRGGLFETTAQRQGGILRINGHKTWTTGGRHLTHMLVGLTLEGARAVVLVEGDRQGIEWEETWGDGLALRATDSDDVFFRDVEVPEANLVLPGAASIPAKPVWFPLMLTAVYLGTALAARDGLVRYCLERQPAALGKSIATLPKIQRQVGEIDMRLQAAQALLLAVADEGPRPAYGRIAAAKQFALDTASEVTELALRAAGGAALSRALPLERCFRDVRAGHMQPPAGDTALEAVGQAALGV